MNEELFKACEEYIKALIDEMTNNRLGAEGDYLRTSELRKELRFKLGLPEYEVNND